MKLVVLIAVLLTFNSCSEKKKSSGVMKVTTESSPRATTVKSDTDLLTLDDLIDIRERSESNEPIIEVDSNIEESAKSIVEEKIESEPEAETELVVVVDEVIPEAKEEIIDTQLIVEETVEPNTETSESVVKKDEEVESVPEVNILGTDIPDTYYGVSCAASPNHPSFTFKKVADGYEYTFSANSGVKSIPVATEVDYVDVYGLDWIIKKREVFKKLGEVYTIKFLPEECRFDSKQEYLGCKKSEFKVKGYDIRDFYFYYALREKNQNNIYEDAKLSFDWYVRDGSNLMEGDNPHRVHKLSLNLDMSTSCNLLDKVSHGSPDLPTEPKIEEVISP